MAYPDINISDRMQITSIQGSAARGGWETRITALSDTDVLEPYQFIQIYWQGIFGTEAPTTAMLAFQGHALPQQLSFDIAGSLATYIASTTDAILRKGWLQGIHFRDLLGNPRTHYHEFSNASENATMGRIVKHILGYYDDLGVPPASNPDWISHGNLVYHWAQNPHGWITLDNVTTDPFADPANLEGSMTVGRYIVRETSDLWSTIRQIAKNEFFVAYFDKEDNFYYKRHPMYGNVLPAPVMTFDESFTIGRPVVYLRHNAANPDVGTSRQVNLHAVQDDGSTIHSEYPASPTHVYGKVDEITYIRCNSQNALDHWAEVHYLYQNRDSTVRWIAPGLCGLLFELYDRVQITYTGTAANGVHIDWTDKKFWIHEIAVTPDRNFSGKSSFLLEAESI